MGPWVEAIPANPKDQATKGGNRHVVARDGLGLAAYVFTDAGAKQHGADETSPGTNGVNDGRTSEIDELFVANAVEPTTIPFPAAGNWIDESGQYEGENHKLAKFDSLSYQAGNDGGSCASKGGLEEEINRWHKASFTDGFSSNGWIEEKSCEVQPAVDRSIAIHEGVANKPIGGHREGKHEEVFGKNIDGVFLTAHAGFDHGEARIHEDHQDRGDQQPKVVGKESG